MSPKVPSPASRYRELVAAISEADRRYYVEDASDREAERQRAAAFRLLESGKPLMVCKTVHCLVVARQRTGSTVRNMA